MSSSFRLISTPPAWTRTSIRPSRDADLVDGSRDRRAVEEVDAPPERGAARGLDGLDRTEGRVGALDGEERLVDGDGRRLLAARLRLLDEEPSSAPRGPSGRGRSSGRPSRALPRGRGARRSPPDAAARSATMALVIPPAAPVTTKTVSFERTRPGAPSAAGRSARLTVKRRPSFRPDSTMPGSRSVSSRSAAATAAGVAPVSKSTIFTSASGFSRLYAFVKPATAPPSGAAAPAGPCPVKPSHPRGRDEERPRPAGRPAERAHRPVEVLRADPVRLAEGGEVQIEERGAGVESGEPEDAGDRSLRGPGFQRRLELGRGESRVERQDADLLPGRGAHRAPFRRRRSRSPRRHGFPSTGRRRSPSSARSAAGATGRRRAAGCCRRRRKRRSGARSALHRSSDPAGAEGTGVNSGLWS